MSSSASSRGLLEMPTVNHSDDSDEQPNSDMMESVMYPAGNTILRGHTRMPNEVLFTHDGRHIISCSDDCTLRVWDATTGETVRVLRGHADWVIWLALSSDGRLVASASLDRTVRVWAWRTGEAVHTLEHHGKVLQVAFSPTSARVASTDADGWFYLWDVETGEKVSEARAQGCGNSVVFSPDGAYVAASGTHVLWVLDGVSGKLVHDIDVAPTSVRLAIFSPDSKSLVSCTREDGRMHVWSVETGELLGSLEGHSVGIMDLAFSPDGNVLASAARDGTIRLWDGTQGTLLYVLVGHADGVRCVAFSPGGEYVVSGAFDTTVRVWDVATGGLLQVLEGHTEEPRCLAFSPDGTRLLSCSRDETLRLWSPWSGEDLLVLGDHSDMVQAVAFSPDGGKFLATGSDDHTVRLWSSASGECVFVLEGHDAGVTEVVYSPNGALLASCSQDTNVCMWNTGTGENVNVLVGHSNQVTVAAFSPDGGKFLATGSDDHTVRLWSSASGECVFVLEGHSAEVSHVAFSPDGTVLASSATEPTARLWDVATGECLHLLEGHTAGVRQVEFSHDGSAPATCGYENNVRLWSVATGQTTHVLGHGHWVYGVAFSPDGQSLATICLDRRVRMWSTISGACLLETNHGPYNPECVALSADGQFVISFAGASLQVWSASTGECVRVLDGHSGKVTAVAVAPDSLRLASSSRDSTVWLWQPGACPTFEHAMKLTKLRDGRALTDKVRAFPHMVLLRAEREGEHCVAGPRGSPLLIAAEARNDTCVRLLLDAVVDRCRAGAEGASELWNMNSSGFVDALPALARSYSLELVETLQRIELPMATDAAFSTLKECTNVEGMDVDETFRTGGQVVRDVGLWQRYFGVGQDAEQEGLLFRAGKMFGMSQRVVGDMGTDVTSRVVPMKGIAGPEHVSKPVSEQPIGSLVKQGLGDALGAPVIRNVLEFKWNRYARTVFLRSMYVYFALVALFTLATVQGECYEVDSEWWNYVRLANDVLVLLLGVYHLRYEARQLRKEGVLGYFSSLWNVLDVVGLVLILVLVPFRLGCWDHASTLQSVAAVCLWLKVLDFFRAFRTTGPFVRMIFRITRAIGYFMLVLVVVMAAFSHGFFLLFRGLDEVQQGEAGGASDFGSWWVLVKMYQLTLGGDFDRTEMALARSEPLALAYALVFSAFATILMLNLLIALMDSVYAEVEENVESEWLLERAQIVLDIDQYMSQAELANEDWFPQWVHVLRARYAKKASARKDVDAKVDQVREEVAEVKAQLGRVLELLEKRA